MTIATATAGPLATRMRRVPLFLVMSLWLVGGGGTEAQAARSSDQTSGRPIGRVRSQDEGIARLLAEGHRASPTFRRLVDIIDKSDLIVYVRHRGQAARLQVGGHIQVMGQANGTRVVFIFITRNLAPVRSIALIAHELQHAVEIAGARHVVDDQTLLRHYERIGTPHWALARRYETATARGVEDNVLTELADHRRQPHAVLSTGSDRVRLARAPGLALRTLETGREIIAAIEPGLRRLASTVQRSLQLSLGRLSSTLRAASQWAQYQNATPAHGTGDVVQEGDGRPRRHGA